MNLPYMPSPPLGVYKPLLLAMYAYYYDITHVYRHVHLLSSNTNFATIIIINYKFTVSILDRSSYFLVEGQPNPPLNSNIYTVSEGLP